MHFIIAARRSEIAAICERYDIAKLEVFGSAARVDDFNPESSDVDFLVTFAVDAPRGLDYFFGFKSALEHLLSRKVDLVEVGAVRNPFVMASINRDRETIYAKQRAP